MPNHKITIACVGDSITELTNYPQHLQNLIGDLYSVVNFGASGSTASFNSDYPYRQTQAYQKAICSQPDIAIIMLGTNDAATELLHNNRSFINDYQTLAKSFQSLPSQPKVFAVLPPPIYSDILGINPQVYEKEIITGITQAAKNLNMPVIDVYNAMQNPFFFFDGIHPNIKGSEIIAETIYQSLISRLK
jgi:acyl-CoA thioesterase-1